jgi:signal transduction histidine kinase
MLVCGDRELLRRAIENVLRNAIHHAPDGTSIEVDLESVASNARIICWAFYLVFLDRQYLVRRHIPQYLTNTAGPLNLYLANRLRGAQAEVDT